MMTLRTMALTMSTTRMMTPTPMAMTLTMTTPLMRWNTQVKLTRTSRRSLMKPHLQWRMHSSTTWTLERKCGNSLSAEVFTLWLPSAWMTMVVRSRGVEKPLVERASQKEKAVERAAEEKANLLEKDTLCLVHDDTFLDVGVQVNLHRLLRQRHLQSPQPVEARLSMAQDSSATGFQPMALRKSLMKSPWWRTTSSAR